MIKLSTRPAKPATLESIKVNNLKFALAQKAAQGEKITSGDFDDYWSAVDVKKALWDMHHGKCCYCERLRDMKRESDVEHFRPKSEVDGEDHPGYWWLAYEWDNYFLSCKKCNQEYKKTKFPLMNDGIRAYSSTDSLEQERPILINPEKDTPEKLIGFSWEIGSHVKAIGLDEDELRGINTVKLLGLNKGTLLGQRAEILSELLGIVEIYLYAKYCNNQTVLAEYKQKIEWQTSSEREFAGFRRYFFKSFGLYGNPEEN